MVRKALLISVTFFLFFSIGISQQTPAKKQKESILLIGATTHVGNGEIIENSVIGFNEGKINYVGRDLSVNNKYDKIVDMNGKHLYPGLIALNTTLGLVEIDAVRATNDINELGDMLPHIRSAIAYNAESKVIESMRPNGVLIAQIVPRGGSISGSSSVMQLDAWNWEDALVSVDEGIHLNWPYPYTRGRSWMGEDPSFKKNENYDKKIDEFNDFFNEAKSYIKNSNPKNLAFEAMKNIFNGRKSVYLHAIEEIQIKDGVNFLINKGVKKIILVGGNEAVSQLNLLKANNIPVIISRPHRLPENEHQDPKSSFRLASKLINSGLLVSIDVSGGMERMNTRNLPFYAGTFAAYGVPKEKALEMITSSASKILGIDNRLGTIKSGKDATLFISEGDVLDMKTNIIIKAFIEGREISLESHQTKLWKRYSDKFFKN